MLPANTREPKIASFEGLRGVLSLLVCCGHVGLNTIAAQFGVSVRFELAVDVFFALSGFVLARAYYFKRRSFSQLLVSRVARLYPLHALTLVWCAVLIIVRREDFDAWLFAQNLVLVQNIGLAPNRWGFNFPSWSISVEMLASLLFYAVLMRRRALLVPMLLMLGIGGSVFAGANDNGPATNVFDVLNLGVVRGISGFSIGAAAYLLTLQIPGVFSRLRPLTPICVLGLAVFFVLPSWSAAAGGLFAVATCLALATSAINDDATILSSRPFVFLGAISYSIYLLHIPILMTMITLLSEERVRGALGKPLFLCVVIAASIACHRFFELPMQRRVLAYAGASQSGLGQKPAS